MSLFSGEVRRVTFANSLQDFYIVQVELDSLDLLFSESSPLWCLSLGSGKTVGVRGYFPGLSLSIGKWISFEGEWKNHKKYGLQIEVVRAPCTECLYLPASCAGILKHLGIRFSGFVEEELISSLPEKMSRPEGLSELPGISREDSYRAFHFWESFRKGFSALGFLTALELPKSKIRDLLSFFGYEIEDLVRKDPWVLGKLPGIQFEVMDRIAKNLNFSLSSYERTRGAVRHCIVACGRSGNLFVSTGTLYSEVIKMIGLRDKVEIAKALKYLVIEQDIFIDSKTSPGIKAIYEQQQYFLETECTRMLEERCQGAKIKNSQEYLNRLYSLGGQISEFVDSGGSLRDSFLLAMELEAKRLKIELSKEQVQGILNGLMEPVSIITGLPGTGKTMSLSVLVSLLMEMQIQVLLVAPTAIAAKRMSSLTGHPAFTIHRAFGAKREYEKEKENKEEAGYTGILKKVSPQGQLKVWKEWEFGGERKFPAQVVICDEVSMLDQQLLLRILDGTELGARLVFVGDSAQLPSVGPGDVLKEMINSGMFPVTSLVQIFRQERTSDIIEAAHQIHRGEVPGIGDSTRDFFLIPAKSEGQAAKIISKVADKLFRKIQEKKNSGDQIETFQVLSPRHRGEAGVTNLNVVLRKVINPEREDRCEAKIGFDVMREGDRIMVIENNYEFDIYNGDLGKVSHIDRKRREAKIKLFGDSYSRFQVMSFEQVSKYLRLAYACTVHKYQGLEVDTVIFPILPSFGWQLQRNLLYTAITRAKKKVILVGQESSLQKAVENDKEDRRNTLFGVRLKKAIGFEPWISPK